MEHHFYKVKLSDGRVIGPLDLERIKLFIINEKITGLETARYYPTGEWKDVNSFPEIAEMFLLKLEGKLKEPSPEVRERIEATINLEMEEKEKSIQNAAFEPQKSSTKQTPSQNPVNDDDEKTVIASVDDEKTIIAPISDQKIELPIRDKYDLISLDDDEKGVSIPQNSDTPEESVVNKKIAQEKTMMLDLGDRKKKETKGSKRNKILVAAGIVISALIVLYGSDNKTIKEEPPFQVEMPSLPEVSDHDKSEAVFKEAIKFYLEDTMSGYKKAARLFSKSISLDSNNVRAICLLASSYMNLIDVVKRDENYFNVVTRLIELGRSKGIDLAETVIADVELYHILSNPDAALNRIVEFSKTHPQFGTEMFYYLSMSFFLKGQNAEALRYLNNIDPKAVFSSKTTYLYGLIYEKELQIAQAEKAFKETVQKSPMHLRARLKLAQIYYSGDNFPEVLKQVDVIISNPSQISKADLAKAYYYRAKTRMVSSKDEEALADLDTALKILPNDADILLDYYTLKSRLGAKIKEASDKAKMFYFLAEGEKALKNSDLKSALNNFMDAREAQRNEYLPILKVAEVFLKKGDLQAAKNNFEKVVALAPKRTEIYPQYIKTLIGAYEFEEAGKVLNIFKDLSPPVYIVDQLNGDLYYGQERYPEAITYFKRALSSINADSSLYISYANSLFRLNNFKDAAFFYGLAQRFDPLNTESILGIGKSLAEIDSLEKGIEYVQNALQSSSNKAALLAGISEIYFRKGDYGTALKFASNALASDANYIKAYKNKGDALGAQDKYKEALDSFQTLINLSPLDPTGYVEKYKLYMKKLDLKASKDIIEKLIRIYPRYPGVYSMLGDVFKEGQNYESAYKAALEEIKLNQTYVPAYYLAGFAANKMGDFNGALQALNKGLKLSPDSVPLLIQSGIANHFLKSYVAAQALLERALVLDAGNPEIHKRLAVLFSELGNKDKAREHFKAYIDLYPNAPDRTEVESLMSK